MHHSTTSPFSLPSHSPSLALVPYTTRLQPGHGSFSSSAPPTPSPSALHLSICPLTHSTQTFPTFCIALSSL